ncbi:MAG: hypothetical protein DRP89_01215 [Candidatus Neomarinimicrobiota bacterium]|nr:MAG: hypothetical protein DRP89_01215 [Candidatus Neomarinimicrobiota bacterium]
MTKNDIFSLALKILGIYALIVAITTIRFSLSMILSCISSPQYSPGLLSTIIASLIPLLLLLTLSYFLIKMSEKLSELLIPNGNVERIKTSLSTKEIYYIAFSIIGVFVIVTALPKLFQVITQFSYFKIHKGDAFSARIGQRLIESSVDVIVRFALGFYLFFGGKGLSTIWHKIHPL